MPALLFLEELVIWMEEKITALYENLRDISAGYLIYQNHDNLILVKKIMPQIQEFVVWFLKENIFGVEESLYQGMVQNLLQISGDIVTAIEQEDCVLMHDAVTYGLEEYLEMFLEKKEEGETCDTL